MGFRLTDVIGGEVAGGTPMRVGAKNTAVYAANVMAADAGARALGDDDPTFTLQPGAQVTTAGPPVKNAHGVVYMPVTVPGRDGPFFIRASSLALEHGPPAAQVPVAAVAQAPSQPWWVWLLLAVGGGGIAFGVVRALKEKKR